MQELITMLERKYPRAIETQAYRQNWKKIQAQFKQLKRLQHRRPDVYMQAVIALVDWWGAQAAPEIEKMRQDRAKAKEMSYED